MVCDNNAIKKLKLEGSNKRFFIGTKLKAIKTDVSNLESQKSIIYKCDLNIL